MPTYQTLALSEAEEVLSSREPFPTDVRPITGDHTERKVVTVVFIDIRNSMPLSREIELEAWWSVSTGLFTLMCEGAERFGGWVGEFTGDGANAVFEPVVSGNHHARRACLAALWLRDAVRAVAAQLRSEHQLEFSVRIGIHSGEVLAGTVGHRDRRFYTVNGYVVSLAKRIEGLARPNRIYLTASTVEFLTEGFQLHDLGAAEVRGAEAPVRVFELVSIADR
jgi:class 3 adenylate cyclase